MTIENAFIEQESSSVTDTELVLSDKNKTARLQKLKNPEKITSNETSKKTTVLKSIDDHESKIPKILILTQGRSGSSFLGSEKKTGFSEMKRLSKN